MNKMPAGKTTSQGLEKPKRKPEVVDKVREIKQRQQNWLLQREHSKQTEIAKPKQANHSASRSVSGGSGPHLQGSQLTNSDREKRKPHVKNEFDHWIRSRNETQPVEDYLKNDFNDSNSVCSGAESELERLVSPEVDISKEPVSEEQFGNLADVIASRVKHDLGISQKSSESSYIFQTGRPYLEELSVDESTWKSARCKTYTEEAPSFNHLGTSALTSHSCIVCNKLMLSSNHIPMMVIPCGHTLCKACSEGRKSCPACKCSVVSLTLNVMLQQVIQEYHSYPVPSTSTLKDSSQDGRNKIVSIGAAINNSFVEDNRRNRHASYQNQLATLQTRYEVLSREHEGLSTNLKKVTSKISHGENQSRNITSQEEEVKKAIKNLQERLAALQEHRKQYEAQITDMYDEKTEAEAKITLLSGTLSSLSREIEKVKLLAEGERDTG